jgi:hypothetical protein
LKEVDDRFARLVRAILLKAIIDEEPLAVSPSSSSSSFSSSSSSSSSSSFSSSFTTCRQPPGWAFTSSFNLDAGTVQALQRNAFEQCGKVLVFSKELGFDALASMLKPLRNRLQYGVKKDLLPLRSLACEATPALLRCLFDAGFTTPKRFTSPGNGALTLLLNVLARRRSNHYLDFNSGGTKGGGEEAAAQRAKVLARQDQDLAERLINAARAESSAKKNKAGTKAR